MILIICCRCRLKDRKGLSAYVNQLLKEVDIHSFVNKISGTDYFWNHWNLGISWHEMQASWTGTIYITFLSGTTQAAGWERTGPLSSPHPFHILIFDPVWKKIKNLTFCNEGIPFLWGRGLPDPFSSLVALSTITYNLSLLHILSWRPRFTWAAIKKK